ncbi:transposable element Tcb1 transposase [Trichonephila clavipes]|nr:transposable element Tcb1 transposase [Trichonephila clavipes]
MWALNNPHSTRPRAMQQRFTVNVWAGIVGYSLLGPYILPPRLDSHKYLVFLQETGHFQTDGLGVVVPSLGLLDSLDLSPLDFFLWGAMKGLVYDAPVVSEMDLVARISIAAARIREMAGVFEDVRQSMSRRCRAYIHANGRNFEHFL